MMIKLIKITKKYITEANFKNLTNKRRQSLKENKRKKEKKNAICAA